MTEKILAVIKNLYPNHAIEKQINRYQELEGNFIHSFDSGDYSIFSTPGRVELSGNHTDHNNGKVLAASIDLDSIAIAAKSQNNVITIFSAGYETPFIVALDDLQKKPAEAGSTISLIRGIAARMVELGYRIDGFNAVIHSEVLTGSGLSSSASIEVLIATIMNTFFNDQKITAEQVAQIGQYAENEYFCKPCGLMDQLACAAGGIISIDFKDPAKVLIEEVEFDFAKQGYDLLLVDSGGSHKNLTDDYAAIPAEMKAVAQFFGRETLRDVPVEEFNSKIVELRKRIGDRAVLRALHFFKENARVDRQVKALKENDFNSFLEITRESGASSLKWLQNIYSVNSPADQGISLALALTENFIDDNKGACRVHGGGFAGTIISFIPLDKTNDYKNLMQNVFGNDAVKILTVRQVGTASYV